MTHYIDKSGVARRDGLFDRQACPGEEPHLTLDEAVHLANIASWFPDYKLITPDMYGLQHDPDRITRFNETITGVRRRWAVKRKVREVA